MKQIISLAFIMLLTITGSFAKDRVSKHTTVKNDLMKVTYGQPSKKGRVIFSKDGLAPFGQVWRTGADEATEITVNKDCMFAGVALKAGTYTLFTVPYHGEWKIILNSKLGQWGSFEYENVKNLDVLESTSLVKLLDQPVETFTITLQKDGFLMAWDQTSVFVTVKPTN